MKKIKLSTSSRKLLADVFTPVSIYLRLRDRFRDTILLESSDFHAGQNNYSYIGINAIGGIEIKNLTEIEYKYPNAKPERKSVTTASEVGDELWKYMSRYEVEEPEDAASMAAQGVFGYLAFDAVQFFETITFNNNQSNNRAAATDDIPLMRYRLYQYVIAINHFKDELVICENQLQGLESDIEIVEGLIKSKDVPTYPFKPVDTESSSLTDEEYIEMVKSGIRSCERGDVFQVVLSRRFQQKFSGDEFNVYRTLRNINPSPYLFYFDYGDYRLIGSSPEAQLVVKNQQAIMHPIAGTFRRTGHDEQDEALAERLAKDQKETAEHVMLVDLARNDLSRSCTNVTVSRYSEVQYFSHVIHLVSEVKGNVEKGANPFNLLGSTFPAGTLSGAPKFKAMEIIDALEREPRSFYGGCLGFIGFDGSVNHAIMIRTFLSRNNTLVYRAGAGIVAASVPESELQEVNNKLNALTAAIQSAGKIGQ